MKRLILFLILEGLIASCGKKEKHFTIDGIIRGIDTGWIFLAKTNENEWIKVDSTQIANERFTFTGEVQFPEMIYVKMKGRQLSYPFFLENSRIKVTLFHDSIEKSIVTGSATNDTYREYLSRVEPLEKKIDSVYSEWKKAKETGNLTAMRKADSISGILDEQMKYLMLDFAKSYHNTVVSPYLIISNVWQFDLPELESAAAVVDTDLNNSKYTVALKNRIELLKKVQVGKPAPEFTMNDSSGFPVSLSSLKGKILLVDFWASWCKPCRAENPNIVNAYRRYHVKGFDILGVSFDTDRQKWIQAIADDQLTWHHVSDLKGWKNSAGKLYGVMSIPSNVLLDRDLKIIARNLRGEELNKKLEEVFGGR